MYIKKILISIAFLGLIGMGVFAYYVYGAIFNPNTAFEAKEAHIYLTSEATYEEVREQLQPLLKDISGFDRLAQKKGYVANVKPGHYILQNGMNTNEIINTLRSHNIPVNVVFNNQERLENLAGRIAKQIEADSLSLITAFRDKSFLAENGFDRETALAMYLPNQYQLYWNTSAEAFRQRMKEEYRRFWTPERITKAKAQGLTPIEVSTLASIVHKETVKTDERPTVAGVYLNRYKNGWKLDADPTVIFALKKHSNNWDRVIKRVLYKDLELDSPYNTYKYKEFPPGPIAMPDITAIEAVLNPKDHNYYYFVADPSRMGYHKFARTLAEHNRNKNAYVRWINKQGINR